MEAGARITHSTVRGPAIIGRGAVIENAYIGPFTSIGDGVTVRGSEVEHSILLEGSSVCDVGARIESSLIGRNVSIYRTATKPRSSICAPTCAPASKTSTSSFNPASPTATKS